MKWRKPSQIRSLAIDEKSVAQLTQLLLLHRDPVTQILTMLSFTAN